MDACGYGGGALKLGNNERLAAAKSRIETLEWLADAWAVWNELEKFPPSYQANKRVWKRHDNACSEIEATLEAARAAAGA